VSDFLPAAPEPPDDSDDGSRVRALKGLGILAGVAAFVVVLMIVVISVFGGGDHKTREVSNPSVVTSEPSSAPQSETPSPTPSPTSASSTSSTSSPPTSTSARPVPTSTANPCLSAAPCTVTDDGGAVAALNQFRVGHGLAPVPGTVSPQAQQCALQQGDGSACASHFAWEPVPTQDGPKAIGMIKPDWLLDPAMKSFTVGWAYAPGPGGKAGTFECAVIKVT